MNWIDIKDRKPTIGQAVIYFFEHVGVHRGKYTEFPDEEQPEFIHEQFGGSHGFLTDDVTHWMPDEGQELPERPTAEELP